MQCPNCKKLVEAAEEHILILHIIHGKVCYNAYEKEPDDERQLILTFPD